MNAALPASLLLATTLFAAPAEWPQFRGPARDGVSAETGLLKEWPKDGPPLAWQIKGLGRGLASVAISGGKILTVAKRKDGQFVVALDLATQKELWSARVSEKGEDPQGAPCVDGNLVFAVSKDGRVLCCEASDGKEVWHKDFAEFAGKMMSGWGYAESPLVDGDKVIVTPGGNDAVLVALNKKTGEVIWKAPMPAGISGRGNDGAGYTGAIVSNAGGIRQYVTLIGHGVLSVAAADGKPLWHYNRVANGTANIPTPLAWDDYVFASSGYGTGAALLKIVKTGTNAAAPKSDEAKIAELTRKLADFNAEIGKRREVRSKMARGTPEYEKADAAVQEIKPDLAKAEEALNKATGSAGGSTAQIPGSPLEVQEQYFLNASTFQNHHGGMVRIGDYIYAGVGHNNGFPLCLAWKTGEVMWKRDRGPGTESAAMIVADGRLYFRYQDGIMALIDASPNGYAERGVFKLPSVDGPSWSHPAIYDGKLYLRDQDTLMCYDIHGK